MANVNLQEAHLDHEKRLAALEQQMKPAAASGKAPIPISSGKTALDYQREREAGTSSDTIGGKE
jgi:hypothetical protein